MALCSASDVETFLEIDLSTTVEGHVTNTFIPYVDAAIKRYLGYDIEQATFTETFDGNEQKDILAAYIETKKPYLEFDVSLGQMTLDTEISSRNLSYIINKAYGCNFYEFINNRRLEVAKQLLCTTDKQVKEIMYESGFSNKTTFNTFFKKQTGKTPSQFRNSFK